MRVLLFTGKGGVGKTTAAAATAALAARRGVKTLVLSTDPAHSLADAYAAQLGGEPTEIEAGLYGQQVDTQRRFEQSWRAVQGYLLELLAKAGVDPMEAEELTVLPGADEVLALLEVRSAIASGLWDLVVVDCAPTGETLRLLALPEAFGWYVERVFPLHRRLVRTLRPALTRATGMPMPRDHVFDAVERLNRDLGECRTMLADPMLSAVRLVLTPEAVVVAESRRTLTSLALHGYRVDAVVANRIFPAGGDEWRDRWAAAQAAILDEVEESFAPLPVLRAPYRNAEPVGVEELTAFAEETYSTTDLLQPSGPVLAGEPLEVERDGEQFVLTIPLPFADKRSVDLVRKSDDIVLTVEGRRRVIALPSALRRCDVVSAALHGGRLRVRFQPDPDVWMRT